MKMKSTAPLLGSAILAAALFGPLHVNAQSQTTSSSGSGISVSTVNGESVVTLNGREIYKGATSGAISSRSSSANGVEYNAVFDGDKLLWESSPGAAQQIGASATPTGGGAAQSPFAQQHQQAVERMMEMQRQFMQTHGRGNLGSNFTSSGGSTFSRGGASGSSSSSGQSSGGGTGSSFGNGGGSSSAGPSSGGQSAPAATSVERMMEMQRQFIQAHAGGNLGSNFSSSGGSTFSRGGSSGSSSSSGQSSGGGTGSPFGGGSGGSTGQSAPTVISPKLK